MPLVIQITDSSDGDEQLLTFEQSPVRIGRNPGNEIPIAKPFVSQWHVQIDFQGDVVSLTDLGSTNGTNVNSQRLRSRTPTRLMIASDVVQIGTLRITVSFSSGAYQQAPPAPSVPPVQTAPPPQFINPSPSGAHQVALKVRIDDGSGNPERILSFPSSPIRVGRNKLNEIIFEQPFVSQFHALVRFQGTEIVVMDLGSTNGTIVKGQRLQPQTPLQLMSPNEDVEIGTIRMRFELAAAEQQYYETSMVPAYGEGDGDDTINLFNAGDWLAEVRGKAEEGDLDPAQVRRMMNRLSRILETFGRSFVELRDGFGQFGKEMGLTITNENTPINSFQDNHEVLEYLLDPEAGSEIRVEELRRAFTDLALHQVALLNGVMTGVRDLLQEIAPEGGANVGHFRALAVLQETEQKRLAMLEEDRFSRTVFGKGFARAYFAVTGQRSDDETP